ncbi:MAG: sensor domain-containing diguanylate cyclase [Deltaproteobacteria bacterium]|nr:sensor domain-containing diguanylate cyclase [Deltaproteobacteria bacterium]
MGARIINSRASLLFSYATGLVGWVVLIFFTATAEPFLVSLQLTPAFVIYLGLGLLTRLLAFRILHSIHISLDSPFYIASIITLGAVPAAWVIAVSMTVDTVRRSLSSDMRGAEGRVVLRADLGKVLLNGGGTGALILAIAALFGTDSWRAALLEGSNRYVTILWLVPVLTMAFLLFHYLITGLSLWFQGFSGAEILRRVVVYGTAAEAALIPLSMVVVLVDDPANPVGLILLGATLVLVNLIFKRMSEAGENLRQRVAELETLNSVGRVLTSSLDLSQIIDRVARETLGALPRAARFTIALWNDRERIFEATEYDRRGGAPETRTIARGVGLLSRVVDERRPVLVSDVERERGKPSGVARDGQAALADDDRDGRARSWMGAPLVVYDEVVGVIGLDGSLARAFDSAQLRVLSAIALETAIAVQNARLYELATVDGLTRLYVRRYFDQRIKDEWRRARRYQTQFSVVLLDLDDFKRVNDEFGHAVGDKVLREVARVVSRNLRGIDIAGRFGGEEFAVVLPRATTAQANKVAERIRADVARETVRANGYNIGITASLGVASFPDCGQKSVEDLVERADIALYRAKRSGKNRVECAPPEGGGGVSIGNRPVAAIPDERPETRVSAADDRPRRQEV